MGWSSPQLLGFPTRRGPRSIARKYSAFTAILLAYVIFVYLAYDYWSDHFDPVKATALCVVLVLIAGAIAKFTSKVLTQPLRNLQEGIEAVGSGRLQPIWVSPTGDEIQFLGESFNAMIEALIRSRDQLRQHQGTLEQRIKERTGELEEASRKAQSASRAKSEFLANVSHELRTPLTGVMGMIDVVLDGKLDPDHRDALRTARGCASSLLRLLNDILDLSKIEAGKMELEEIPFDFRCAVRECAEALRPTAEAKGLHFRTTIAPDVPSVIAGDPTRIRQILSNLLSNAVKFTESGSVILGVEAAWLDDQPCQLRISVSDTGAGIPANKVEAIFDEFTQADGSISRKYGGTGLGLAITRRLVSMVGGNISVQTELGKGSTFRVQIPVRPVCELGASPMDVVPKIQNGRETILVVEDNPINQKVVSAILKKHGYQVVCANHGGEVIDSLENHDVGLVLMDIQMPGIDGLEATRLIRSNSRWKHIPVVAVTAHAMNGDRDVFLSHGMDGYLSKPINRPQLMAEVERCLVRSQRGLRDDGVTFH